jgi:hypothetical protein
MIRIHCERENLDLNIVLNSSDENRNESVSRKPCVRNLEDTLLQLYGEYCKRIWINFFFTQWSLITISIFLE